MLAKEASADTQRPMKPDFKILIIIFLWGSESLWMGAFTMLEFLFSKKMDQK